MAETYHRQSLFHLRQQYSADEYDWGNPGNKPAVPSFIARGCGQEILSALNTADGFYNPSWKSQIRNGSDATTSFSGIRKEYKTDWFSAQWAGKWGGVIPGTWSIASERYYYGIIPPGLPLMPSLLSSVQTSVTNRCIAKFNAQVKQAQSSLLAGEVLHDLGKTLHSITHPLQSLKEYTVGYLTSLKKKKRFTPSKRMHQVLADSYLEWRFGINPFLGDIAAGIVNLGKYRYPVTPVQASAHSDYFGDIVKAQFLLATSPIASPRFNYTAVVKARYKVKYKGAVRTGSLEETANGAAGLAQDLRLYPRDWLPTIWEVIPYSWVVDYFTNVGDIVNAYSVALADLTWGCKVTVQEVRQQFDVDSMQPVFQDSPGINVFSYSQSMQGGSTSYSDRVTTRTKIGSNDLVPTLQLNVPLSSRPWENIAALIASKVKDVVPFTK